MAKKKIPEMNPLQMQTRQTQLASFNTYLLQVFKDEDRVQAVPEAHKDELYRAYCAGYNYAIIDTAAKLLESVGIKLNITAKDIKK